jgi:hypothetical protein
LAAAMGSHTMKLRQGGDSDEDAAEEKADHEGEDKDTDKDDKPAPIPEPSTLMSFGVALLIGGGVFFLGRLRKERK